MSRMNAESFITYLAQPAKLYQLPYQEIKNLVEEYPYSANLRRLLLLKSKIEQDPKFEQYLHDLASSTLDRRHLYAFVTKEIPQLLQLETEPLERLELQDLLLMEEKEKIPVTVEEENPIPEMSFVAPPPEPSALDLSDTSEPDEDEPFALEDEHEPDSPAVVFEFDTLPARPETDETPTDNSSIEEEEIPVPEMLSVEEEEEEITDQEEESAAPSSFLASSDIIQNLVACSLLNGAVASPQPKTQFESWKKKRRSTTRNWKALRQQPTQATTSSPKAKEVARQSVQDPTNLASETLAKLLIRQGQYRKAIKIYQRLSLLYPEKSRYFAATIEELKLKL